MLAMLLLDNNATSQSVGLDDDTVITEKIPNGDVVLLHAHEHGFNESELDQLDIHSLYAHNPPPYAILFVFVTVGLGVLMRVLQPRIPVPYTVVIMVLGIIYGTLSATVYPQMAVYTRITEMDPHWLLQIFLPILLFESAFTIDIQIFKKAVGLVLILATCGLALAACLTAVVAKFMFGYGWDWLSALMFGALISATDPVAVVALLKDLGASPELGVVLEGESLLNDGTAIILFNVFLALSTPSDNFSGESLALQSILVVAGGPLFGFICGRFAVLCIANISNDAISEICIILATAYLTYYVSEVLLNVSGVLAVVILGLVLNCERTVISPEVEPWIHEFWSTLTYIANTLIFAVVGLTVSKHALPNFNDIDWLNLLMFYSAIVFIRLISIGVFLPIMRYVPSAKGYNWRNVLVMSWGGLRGAVSLALAMTVSRDPRINQNIIGDKILLHTSGIVMLTLCVNGTTTSKLLSLLGLNKISEETTTAVDNALHHIFDARSDEISVLKQDPFLADANWEDVANCTDLINPYKKAKKAKSVAAEAGHVPPGQEMVISNLDKDNRNNSIFLEDYEFIRVIWLKLLKRSFWEQFERGMISRRVLVFLSGCVDHVMNQAGCLVDADTIMAKWRIGHRLTYCQKLINKLAGHEIRSPADVIPAQSLEPKRLSCVEVIVSACWFKTLVYFVIAVHVTASIVNLALNWHGHHLDEDFFHENIYFLAANGVFCVVYGLEIMLTIAAFGLRRYFAKHWNKLEILVVLILLVDLSLDIYVLAYGDGGSAVHKVMLRFFDVLSLLRVLRGIRLIKLVFPMMEMLMESLVTHRLMHGFDVGKAFTIGQGEATKQAQSLVQNSAALSRLKESAEGSQKTIWRDLDVLLAERPDIAGSVRKRYVTRKVLYRMQKDLSELRIKGLIDDKAALLMQKTLERKMKKAARVPYRVANPDDLLQKISWIAADPQLRSFLLSRSTLVKFPKHHNLITAGQEGCGVYLLLSGIVKPVRLQSYAPELDFTEKGDALASGDVVGDYLVLTGKRSPMTYSCQTNVQALFVTNETFQQALSHFPHLRPDMWSIWGARIAVNLLMSQPTLQHISIKQLKKRILKGSIVFVQNETFVMSPEREVVILLHGHCTGDPQQIPLEGPKIISNRFQLPDRGKDLILFVINHNLAREPNHAQTAFVIKDAYQEHHL